MNILFFIKKKTNMVKLKLSFNKWATSYDAQVHKASPTDEWMFGSYDRVLDKVVEYCRLKENSYTSALDIGTGTGNLAARFCKYNMQVTSIDPSSRMRKIYGKKYPAISVLPGDFLNYPRSLPQVDVIVSAYAFHHLTALEKIKAVSMMKSLLKPKGRIVIADFMFKNAAEVGRVRQSIRETSGGDILATFKDEYPGLFDDLTDIFRQEGFTVDGEQLTVSVWIIRACL
jgi:putative AdoMet-dependent methyltransferase